MGAEYSHILRPRGCCIVLVKAIKYRISRAILRLVFVPLLACNSLSKEVGEIYENGILKGNILIFYVPFHFLLLCLKI